MTKPFHCFLRWSSQSNPSALRPFQLLNVRLSLKSGWIFFLIFGRQCCILHWVRLSRLLSWVWRANRIESIGDRALLEIVSNLPLSSISHTVAQSFLLVVLAYMNSSQMNTSNLRRLNFKIFFVVLNTKESKPRNWNVERLYLHSDQRLLLKKWLTSKKHLNYLESKQTKWQNGKWWRAYSNY